MEQKERQERQGFSLEDLDEELSRLAVTEGVGLVSKDRALLVSGAPTVKAYDFKSRHNIGRIIPVPPEEFRELFEAFLLKRMEEEAAPDEVEGTDDSSEVLRLLEEIIGDAVAADCSDIHLTPKGKVYEIKFREMGRLSPYRTITKRHGRLLVNKVKLLAQLDITNTLTPQDGKIRYRLKGDRQVEIRVATCPTIEGEEAVLRIQTETFFHQNTLDTLGFAPEDLETYRRELSTPYGMILNVGATGQGKSTTFYLSIKELLEKHGETKNIITVEDPVEVRIPGVVQVEVNEKTGLTFARVLRSALRLDPDIILVGEIRDEETASIAVRAALTGHLVLATLHANNAVNAIARLKDLGISGVLITSVVNCILSQRLLRKLCPVCKKKTRLSPDIVQTYGLDFEEAYEPGNTPECPKCRGQGYWGRTAVFEVLKFDPALKELVASRASETAILKHLAERKFKALWDRALEKVKAGETSLSEVLSVLRPEEARPTPANDRLSTRYIFYPRKLVKVKVENEEGLLFDLSGEGLSLLFRKPLVLDPHREYELSIETPRGERQVRFRPKNIGEVIGEGILVGGTHSAKSLPEVLLEARAQ